MQPSYSEFGTLPIALRLLAEQGQGGDTDTNRRYERLLLRLKRTLIQLLGGYMTTIIPVPPHCRQIVPYVGVTNAHTKLVRDFDEVGILLDVVVYLEFPARQRPRHLA